MSENGYNLGFLIDGFTKCIINSSENDDVAFNANPNPFGGEWYDFCMVNFDVCVCTARIHGFFQYATNGVPTNALLQESHTINKIHTRNMKDKRMYAVIYAATSELDYDTLERQFVSKFILGNVKRHHYTIDIANIVGPLMAIPNIDSDKESLFAVCPYRWWGQYFLSFIRKCSNTLLVYTEMLVK